MVTFKDGKLNIKSDRSSLELLLDLSFLALLTVVFAFSGTTEGENYLYYVVFFLTVGLTFLCFILGKSTVKIKLPTIWYGAFIVLCVLSTLWAKYDVSLATKYISRMVQVLVICYCITLYIRTRDDLERFMSIFNAAVLIMIISIFIRTPNAYIFTGYFGKNASGYVTGSNINVTAYICVIGIAIAFYRAHFMKNRIYYLITAFEFFTVVLTGSRKALIMSLMLVFVMSVFYVKSRFYVLKMAAIAVAVVGVIVLLLKVPALYESVGFRIEKMMDYFINDDATRDGSLGLRAEFGDIGKQVFYEHPAIGIGLGNAHYLIELTYGYSTYLHNNYVEVASSLGTVGLVTYYWFYLYLLIALGRRAYKGEKLYVMLFLALVVNMVGEIAMVTFYNYSVHILLTLCYCALKLNDEPKKTYMNIDD